MLFTRGVRAGGVSTSRTSRNQFLSSWVFMLMLAIPVICALATSAHAQYGSLPVGQVTNVTAEGCPTSQWYPGTSCFSATLTGCANISDLSFTFGYLNPTTQTANGTIVFFNGSDGTEPAGDSTGVVPGETQYVTDYLTAGYQIVQVAWSASWEQALFPWPLSTQPLGNVQAAACRPATFLNYVFNSINLYQGVLNGNGTLRADPNAGMCAQGASAGSAQIAYSLSYYGPPAGTPWWIDNVELISGPVLSDIEQGCMQPGPTNPTKICPPDQHGNPQYGCRLGTGSYWSLFPTYLTGPNHGVGGWTDDTSCANGSNTSTQSNNKWLAQSIVDQSQGATPTFNFSSTAMSAWLCRSVQNQQTAQNCATNYVKYDNYCPNNSSPQGQIFYSQIGQSNSPPSYNVYAVDNCYGPEGATSSAAYVTALPITGGYQDGYDAVKLDMIAACKHP
jgi:hypothetical protein